MDTLPPTDLPIQTEGYFTDPKLVGYQVLTNYESIYWRALLGSEAWSLYEVLRGHCHQHDPICEVTINTLIAILGIRDRRELTGRVKTVKGKEYRYPGLIEILQMHGLVVAEVLGDGPKMRYKFHVNLTPGLLSDTQVAALPDVLQRKHIAHLRRVAKRSQELQARRRPPKVLAADLSTPLPDSKTRLGNSQAGVGNSHTQPGKFPDEQDPHNSLKTTTGAAAQSADLSLPEPQSDVVVALQEIGFKPAQARKLAVTAAQAQRNVHELIAFMRHKQQHDPASVTKPQAWLTAGIARGYDLSVWYKIKEEQQNQAAKQQQSHQEQQRMSWQLAHKQRLQETEQEAQRQLQMNAMRQQYQTTEREMRLWTTILNELKQVLTSVQLSLLTHSELLALNDSQAVVCLSNAFIVDQVQKHAGILSALQNALQNASGADQLDLNCVSPPQSLDDGS